MPTTSAWATANNISLTGATLEMSPQLTYGGSATLSNASVLNVDATAGDDYAGFGNLTVTGSSISAAAIGGSTTSGDLNVSGTLTANTNASVTVNGNITVGGALAIGNNGLVTSSGNDTVNGGITGNTNLAVINVTTTSSTLTVYGTTALASETLQLGGGGSMVFNGPVTGTTGSSLVMVSTSGSSTAPAKLWLNGSGSGFLGSVTLDSGETIVTANQALRRRGQRWPDNPQHRRRAGV